MSSEPTFPAPISERIWQEKYRFQRAQAPGHARAEAGRRAERGITRQGDRTLGDTFARVAKAAAANEKGGKKARKKWAQKFEAAMRDFGFLPAGRILAGAGTGRDVTLFNCFVLGTIDDDLGAIFDHVRQAALTMQQGGGIGHDFSTLRPKGALVASIGADASGPVSFMNVWDAMCQTIMSAGARRGAMMATLRVDHPDIEAFIDAKSDPEKLRNFNLSVLVTDAFMDAVQRDAPWDLVFNGKVYRTLDARALWQKLMRATYDYAEPGVIFIDRINTRNNLSYCETIHATNPCGEQPLPPYGACLLGSINLTRFIANPFHKDAALDRDAVAKRVAIAVRLLDNMIDVSQTPLKAQHDEAHAKRRIGLGVTGLADALIALNVDYDSKKGRRLAESWMKIIQNAAYRASAELAAEKGAFPLYDKAAILAAPNVQALSKTTRKLIAKHGLRNGCLTSIAPTGTISLLAGNVSSGIEPVFDARYERTFRSDNGSETTLTIEDYACGLYREVTGRDDLPPAFVTAGQLSPKAHLQMQAALQPFVDSSISKTINCAADLSFEDFQSVYLDAYALGLKGCTTYRPNAVTGSILAHLPEQTAEPLAEIRSQDPVSNVRPTHETTSNAPVSPLDRENGKSGDVVYVAEPLDRGRELAGTTYKLKWPEAENALYITINDIELDGRKRPYEIFINTRHLEHYAWTVALTRMISAVFRRGGDVAFVASELKEIFDPQGGRWMDGRYVPSLLAAIGDVIETHMRAIGFLAASGPDLSPEVLPETLPKALPENVPRTMPEAGPATFEKASTADASQYRRQAGRSCPRCASANYVRQESCWVCLKCGFSRCD